MSTFNLEAYLSQGVREIVQGIIKTTFKNPHASLYMMRFSKDSHKAEKVRKKAELKGDHIPPFLIASITDSCNLHCAGCYARANDSCCDGENTKEKLNVEQWGDIFRQAADMGISFVLLAGGEPFVRKDILTAAAQEKRILFPIFTNGTMIDANYLDFLSDNPNLVPLISVEGNEETTDQRRGAGVYKKIRESMHALKSKGNIFGVSVTVTKDNLDEVFSDAFLYDLKERGCKAVIYVEYVPVDGKTHHQAFDEETRKIFEEKLNLTRVQQNEMLFIAFPGDEKSSGGCLAAGRGFFHINPYGAAEPCPFSPYSDTSLMNTSLKEALKSPLFLRLQNSGNLLADHTGGCVLFEQEDQVKALLERTV
ncbi:radical SAM protein [Eubacteriaceae bacterium ES3]|nr:radical SAM protein [Eubacteriaceae bacterium ES3]